MLVKHWAREPHNLLSEAIAGHAVWSIAEQLSAYTADLVAVGNYYTLRAAGVKSARKPRPLPRPWDAKPVSFGKGAIPLTQIDDWIESTIRED